MRGWLFTDCQDLEYASAWWHAYKDQVDEACTGPAAAPLSL